MRRRIWLIILGAIMLCLVIAAFAFKGAILGWAFKKVQASVHQKYHATLTASSVSLAGVSKVVINDLVLVPDGADTLLRLHRAEAGLSLPDLLRGRLTFTSIDIDGATLTVFNNEGRNNILFLKTGTGNKTTQVQINGFREQATVLENKLFNVLNVCFNLKDVYIRYYSKRNSELLYIPVFTYNLKNLSGIIVNQNCHDTLSITGAVLKNKELYQCTFTHFGNDSAYLPFFDSDSSIRCSFRSITARINFDNSRTVNKVSADAELNNFCIAHWRLAKDEVVFEHAKFTGKVLFTDNRIELDSSSTVALMGVPCHLYAQYSVYPDTAFALGLNMPQVNADSFFRALPAGMFSTLKGISCSGTLAYNLAFCIHTNDPDSLKFYSALTQKDLHIRHFGAEDYTRINAPFTYDAYDKGRLVRHINIGTGNPYYTPLNLMPPYLPQTVLQAEDPSFMEHRGFYMDAFRESIAKNYKEHRFARGGSTISMQLVKNIFLSRDKTISRKAEEALIVYLIENLRLVPKERMLEVYLNAIEWGPDVYGIGEAAHFYFNKKPAQLTLQECLFLSSIIPRPKSFQYQFDRQGQLRTSLGDYFKILTTRMVWRGVLNPADTIGLKPEVTLKGAAMYMVVPRDSMPIPDPEDNTD